ncbi:MAG TPA: hypothetical protein VGQ21_12195 [Thermoanaerobaculia bacterium]|jgi:hypothetical protein|nr:hypothetical protein [Thermoanaerobaculia bacterium]
MLETELIVRIRDIFLHQRPHVSISAATALLGWTRREMSNAVRAGEIEVAKTEIAEWVWREELIAKALDTWPLEVIEEALGADAERVLPESRRSAEVRALLPRYQIAMLHYLAEQNRTTVSDILTRELEDVASANADELSAAIPGFASAFEWPNRDDAQVPC